MLRAFDLNLDFVAILENAHAVGYNKERNVVHSATFTMPLNDPKNEKINALHYIDIPDIGLCRVMPKFTNKNTQNQTIKYELQHVLSTLTGSVLFKYHQLSNYTTREILQYLIDQQKVKHWKLGQVDFTRYFHYSWENENLLSALLSVPKPFNEQYRFTYDTSSYPWTINLVRTETVATARIREGYNIQGFSLEENPMGLYNRIYPLGAGEGVNQVDIRKVNGGKYYLEDTVSIAKYGVQEYVWSDKRFTDAQSLKESCQALLDSWKVPLVTWQINARDLSSLTGIKSDKLTEGKLIKMEIGNRPPFELHIVKEQRSDVTKDPTNVQLTIGNLNEIGSTQTELKRRQQINELYSQGATNIMNFTYQDNCDNAIPAVIPFYIDDDVVNVNTIELTYRTKKFRAYSGVTSGGGGLVKSTTSGGGTTATSSSGGGVSTSTASGGGSSQTSSVDGQSTETSSANGLHSHNAVALTNGGYSGTYTGPVEVRGLLYQNFEEILVLAPAGSPSSGVYKTFSEDGVHTHSVTTPAHSHGVDIPSHTHDFNVPAHTHSVTVPAHSHDIDIPSHTHEIVHKIVEAPNNPASVIVKVDGNVVPITALTGDRINVAPYMAKDTNGNVTRGRHEITITPNTIARVEADVILRVFIRSQLGIQM